MNLSSCNLIEFSVTQLKCSENRVKPLSFTKYFAEFQLGQCGAEILLALKA